MKTLVFNMLTIAATFAAMTACTSESDPVDEVQTKGKTPIEFSSSILGVQTKAIVSDDQFQDGQKIGIYGYKTAEPSSDYLTTNFINNKEFTYSGSTFTATDAYWERDATHFFLCILPSSLNYCRSNGLSTNRSNKQCCSFSKSCMSKR